MRSFKEIHEGIYSTYRAFSFAALLAKPFQKWQAYEMNLIDSKGNIIKKPETTKEKAALTTYDNLVRKVKRLFHKFIPDNRLFTTLVSYYLLKTESLNDVDKLSKEILENKLTKDEMKLLIYVLEKETFKLEPGLSTEDARKQTIGKIKSDHRGFKYDSKTGICVYT